MKKIIIGIAQTSLSPITILFGDIIISNFQVHENAMLFASIMGGISVCVNFIMGFFISIEAYKEYKIL